MKYDHFTKIAIQFSTYSIQLFHPKDSKIIEMKNINIHCNLTIYICLFQCHSTFVTLCQGRMINDRKRREIIDPIAGSSNAGFLTAGYSSAGILAGGVV